MTNAENQTGKVGIAMGEPKGALPPLFRAFPEGPIAQLRLEDLSSFEVAQIPLGPQLGERLEASAAQLVILTHPDNHEAAMIYPRLIGRADDRSHVVLCNDPVAQAQEITEEGIIPLVVTRATDPMLKEMMFRNFNFGQLLADRFPVPNRNIPGATPILHCVGITQHGIRVLTEHADFSDSPTEAQALEQKRSRRIKEILGDILTATDFHRILQSPLVEHVILHALGPRGTNISQAATLYISRLGISHKAQVRIHDTGITPMEYSQMAAEETERLLSIDSLPRQLHLHMECAVYHGMGELYEQRAREAVFSDVQDMALDNMQLGAKDSLEKLQQIVATQGSIRIATHPSPRSLVLPWLERRVATWIQASSNSAAARMVVNGEADACVTTASAVALLSSAGISTLHGFGSPNMIFTVASPLTHDQLRLYLNTEGKAI